MTVLAVALAFFLFAALLGAFLARGHANPALPPPPALVVGHPMLTAAGLILLGGAYVRGDGSRLLTAALVVLVVAAAGGIGLAYLRFRRGRAPWILVVSHAALALSGVVLILLELVGGARGVPPPV